MNKENIKRKLDTIQLTREDFDQICKDRLDFGFDSIYFRYAEAIQELSFFKDMEAKRQGRDFDRKFWVDGKLMHFYLCLEQLTHAHPTPGETKDISTSKLKAEEACKLFRKLAETTQEATGGI